MERATYPETCAASNFDGADKPDKQYVGPQHCPDARRAGPEFRLWSVVQIVRLVGPQSLCFKHGFLLQPEPHSNLWMFHCLAV